MKKGIKILLKYCELAVLLVLAIRSDTKSYKINNSLIVFFILIGSMTNGFLQGFVGFCDSLLGITLPIILLFVLFLVRMVGAGDIKLFSSIGAIMGREFILETLIFTALTGGILALILILVKKNGRRRWKCLYTYLKYVVLTSSIPPYQDFAIKEKKDVFPLSCSISLGVLVKILLTQ